MSWNGVAALLVLVFGAVAAPCAVVATHDRRAGLAVLLELWTAAALLRLTASATWLTLGAVVALLLVRLLVSGRGRRSLSSPRTPHVAS